MKNKEYQCSSMDMYANWGICKQPVLAKLNDKWLCQTHLIKSILEMLDERGIKKLIEKIGEEKQCLKKTH